MDFLDQDDDRQDSMSPQKTITTTTSTLSKTNILPYNAIHDDDHYYSSTIGDHCTEEDPLDHDILGISTVSTTAAAGAASSSAVQSNISQVDLLSMMATVHMEEKSHTNSKSTKPFHSSPLDNSDPFHAFDAISNPTHVAAPENATPVFTSLNNSLQEDLPIMSNDHGLMGDVANISLPSLTVSPPLPTCSPPLPPPMMHRGFFCGRKQQVSWDYG